MNAAEEIAQVVENNVASLLGLEEGAQMDRRRRLEAMGLDSLLAMDLLSTLEAKYGALPDTVLRDYPTIQQLADYLHGRQAHKK